MSMSVTQAEAGLIAAPWDAARQNDPGLAAAAKAFYEQSRDLTQHGKKDHPTDRIVLDDVAATLALQLGAQDPGHRAGSLSEYVKLPGSGDGFNITVYADGHETLNRTPDGPEGKTSQPGAAAVIARYAAVIGHVPSQDEMAGFLAAAVAGGGLPAGTDPAGVQLSVSGQGGAVLATGTAAELLAQWSALLAANEEVTPIISLASASPGEKQQQPPILNGTEGAAFLLGLAVQGGGASSAMVAGYNATVSYFDRIDQPMLAVAVHYQQAAAAEEKAGNQTRATLDETAAKLALQIAAEPEGSRGSLSDTLHVGGKETRVTVSQTSTDITGGAQFHDIDQGLGGIIEQVVGIVADVLSFVPVVDAVAIPVAIAVGAAEGAQELSDGDILGGVLALAGAAAGGVGQYASTVADAVGSTTADVTSVAQDVSRGVAAAQGVDGAVTGAEDGDPLAVLTSLAGGVAGSAGAGTDWGRGLAVGSALTGAGVAAAGGNWMSALAATETAASGAGLFGARDPDASSPAPTGSDGSSPPPDWQSAAVLPVQQQELPALASTVADTDASTAPAAQASVAAAVIQDTDSDSGPDAPGSPDGSSQQQADAQQAAQAQAAQKAGAVQAATQNTASQPLTVPPVPPAGGPPAAPVADPPSLTASPEDASATPSGAAASQAPRPDLSQPAPTSGAPASDVPPTSAPSGPPAADTPLPPGGNTGPAARLGPINFPSLNTGPDWSAASPPALGSAGADGPASDPLSGSGFGPVPVPGSASGTSPSTLTLNVYAPAPDSSSSAPAALASGSPSSNGSSNPPPLLSGDLPNGPGGSDGSTWIGRQAQAVYNALPTAQHVNGIAEIVVGSVAQVGGALATGVGLAGAGVGVLTSEIGVGIPVAGAGLGLAAGGLATIQAGNTMVSQGQSDLNAPPPIVLPPAGPTPVPVPSASAPPTDTAASSGSLSGARIDLGIGNSAAMTGLDAGAIPANPGFSIAPPAAPDPGYTPVGDDQVNLGHIETFPIADQPIAPNSTGTPIPSLSLPTALPGPPIDGSMQLPTVLMATSPNSTMRGNANASGTYVDPMSNEVVPSNSTLAADHIYPQSAIKQLPGFDQLSDADQNSLLNDPINTQGLPQTYNSSKGAQIPGQWQTYKGQPLDPNYVANDATRADALRQYFVDKIATLKGP